MRRFAVLAPFLLVSLCLFAQKPQDESLPQEFKPSQVCLSTAAINCPPPTFVLDVQVWASTTLINQVGEAKLQKIVRESANAFFLQTGIRLVGETRINPVIQEEDDDTLLSAQAIPRKLNSLLIFLSHKRFATNPQLAQLGLTYGAFSGSSWMAVWVDPARLDLRSTIIHELGHEFGLADSDNKSSVMCTMIKNRECTESIYFDKPDLEMIARVVKVMKKISFDLYNGLRGLGESFNVYSVKTTVTMEKQ